MEEKLWKTIQRTEKQRHYFTSKCLYSQSYGFTRNHEWMWKLDHNKAGFQRIDAFKMWCWIRLLRVPWTARRFNQSMLKEISPEYSLERPILKLNLQYFGQLMGRTDSWEKTLMQGKIKGRRQIGKTEDEIVGWHHRPDEHESEQAPGVGDGQGNLAYCNPWYRKELDMTERLNWTNVQIISGNRQKPLGSSQSCGPGGSGERFRWKGRLPILWCRCLNPRQGAQDFEYVTKYFFLIKKKKKQLAFCRSDNFDWVCSLDFTEACGRNLEWAESAKIRWPAAGGSGLW